MEKFENKTDNKTKAKEKFLSELEDRMTDPEDLLNTDNDRENLAKILQGKKVSGKAMKAFKPLFFKVCQDWRLTPDETDELEKEIFE